MKKISISIIVPVYNAEKFLNKCIDSILNQSEENLELILVDDGSADNSGKLCDEYASNDYRVKVIHQDNAGVSVARNMGLRIAQGEYIGFVDSDDWVLPEMYSRLLKKADEDNADIVMCDTTTVYPNGTNEIDTISKLIKSQIINNDSFKPELLLEMAGSACRCIYRKELLMDRNIQFPVGVKFSEDRIFNLYSIGYGNKVSYLKESYYMRFINTESAVHRFHEDYFECVKKAFETTVNAIKVSWNDDGEVQNVYLSHFINGAIAAINNYFYKTSTFSYSQRLQAVKYICKDIELRDAIKKTGYGGIRGKWILRKMVMPLCICAQVLNWKYGR